MSDIRFYGEGKCEYARQMFLSEEGVFYWGTRKELVEDYRQRYPDRHLMVYLYSQDEYERNKTKEESRKLVDWYKKYNEPNEPNQVTTYESVRRELGFDFAKDNGIER